MTIPIASPDLGREEEEAVLRVLRSGRLAQGPEVESLEAEFAEAHGVDHAVAVCNGTAALQAALHGLRIGPGDEVLVPAFTFAATAGAVLAEGAVPVFVDVGSDYLLDLDHAATMTTDATAAVMPVHLFGLMADMDAVESFARRHGLAVIEDAAQAHLARRGGRSAGTTGVGAFSLYATKNMTTGEGGMVTTNDGRIAEQVRLYRNHGMPQRYVHTSVGLNLRLTDLQAAIGRVQLGKLPAATKTRRENAVQLDARLPRSYRRPPTAPDAFHVYHQYTVAVQPEERDRMVAAFRDRGIGVAVYYPTPVHRQEAFAPWSRGPLPGAEDAARSVISLPVHPAVGDDGIDHIVTVAGEVASR